MLLWKCRGHGSGQLAVDFLVATAASQSLNGQRLRLHDSCPQSIEQVEYREMFLFHDINHLQLIGPPPPSLTLGIDSALSAHGCCISTSTADSVSVEAPKSFTPADPMKFNSCGRLPIALLVLPLLWACASREEIRLSMLHHFERGNLAFKAEDYPGAIKHFRAALELDDRSADLWYNLGLALYEAGMYPDAIEAFQEALEIDPKRADTHYNLALAYHRNYDRDSAHSHYHAYREITRTQGASPSEASAANGAGAGRASTLNPTPSQRAAIAAQAGGGANPSNAASEGQASSQRQPASQASSGARDSGEPSQQRNQNPARQPQRTNPAPNQSNPFEGNEEWWKADLPPR